MISTNPYSNVNTNFMTERHFRYLIELTRQTADEFSETVNYEDETFNSGTQYRKLAEGMEAVLTMTCPEDLLDLYSIVCKRIKKEDREKDPEYKEYIRLKKKFEEELF